MAGATGALCLLLVAALPEASGAIKLSATSAAGYPRPHRRGRARRSDLKADESNQGGDAAALRRSPAEPAAALSAENASQVMAITGYWRLTSADTDSGNLRNGPGGYLRNMPVVMTLNTPMTIFGDAFGLENMRKARGDANPPLYYAEEVNLTSLPPCSTHSTELRATPLKYTHPMHAPSVSLGCIWDGKLSLVAKTARNFPGFKWYAWLDVGMHAYKFKVIQQHGRRPWPNPEKLATLPSDRMSIDRTFACHTCQKGNWTKFCHCIAATAMMIPASLVQTVTDLFYEKMEECFDATRGTDTGFACISEQHILTQVYLARPELFHISGKGYGSLAANLTATSTEMAARSETSELFDFLSSDVGEVTTRL